MKALKDCKWLFKIKTVNYSGESVFIWDMTTEVPKNDIQFSNGGIGRISCVRMFNSLSECRKHIRAFTKINRISKYKIKRI